MGATQRVLEYLDFINISKYEFYKRTGLSNGFLDKGQNIGSDKCQKISEAFPGLNIAWVITGKGKPEIPYISEEELKLVKEPASIYKKDRKGETQRIPLFEFKATAGLSQLLDKPGNILDYIEIPNLPQCDGAISVIGDSMYPIVKAGDIVIYKWVNDLRNGIIFGEMYIVSVVIDEQLHTLFKFIKKSETEDHIQLVSYNPQHAAMDVHYDNIGALALVKASIRYNTMS